MATKTPGRKKSGVNKAQAIRDEFAAQGPAARNRDVIDVLHSKGIKVSSAQVSNIKAALGKTTPGGKGKANGAISYNTLVEAKKLADRIGGLDVARRALDALAQLR